MSFRVRVRRNGFSLVEVLVALLIFTVGTLGQMAVQIQAKRNLFEARQYAFASGLASDMLARIMTNSGELPLYLEMASGDEVPEPTSDCVSHSCTSAQLAIRDFYDWGRLIDGRAERVNQGGEQSNRTGLLRPQFCFSEIAGGLMVEISWRGMTAQSSPGTSMCGESIDISGQYRRQLLVSSYSPEA